MIHYVGVLNITPDSFSDGGEFLDPKQAVARAKLLMEQGAELIDVGGESTRPGSSCVGPEVEWKRIEPVLNELRQHDIPFSVDTYRATTAARAVDAGAQMINDVTAGSDPEMFSVIAEAKIPYVMMYSRCSAPHEFSEEQTGDIIEVISSFFNERIALAVDAGITREQLILDPGMGKFISDHPERSWDLIRRINEFSFFDLPLYVGVSRKGFLKLPHEASILERDYLTAFAHKLLIEGSEGTELYLRSHSFVLTNNILSS